MGCFWGSSVVSGCVPGASAQSIVVRPTEIHNSLGLKSTAQCLSKGFRWSGWESGGPERGYCQELLGPPGDFSCILQEWSIYLYDRLVLC
jgi:hypothetical protein